MNKFFELEVRVEFYEAHIGIQGCCPIIKASLWHRYIYVNIYDDHHQFIIMLELPTLFITMIYRLLATFTVFTCRML